MVKVVRVTRIEFELENGDVFPIDPPLSEEMTPSEFQEHYDFAATVVQSRQFARRDHTDSASMGRKRDHQDDS